DPRLSRAHLASALVAGKRVERQRWDRLKAIDAYATATECRRVALLRYFGDRPSEPRPDPCCDRCQPAATAAPAAAAAHRPAGRSPAAAEAAVLQAVDDTAGTVGRTRLSQILPGSAGGGRVGRDRRRAGAGAAGGRARGPLGTRPRRRRGGPRPACGRDGVSGGRY